ncbi:hypothetical protein B7P43_G12335 [Cryptotermes secundus]|uniref:Uncharacterized protein n=1 Tax=Cryptotermes secundus TaxID=105785 RepID=A0A2J7QYK2_9NEOP|nr:hypothetical protein B7P43_G12335 [Cryptotermes secundus]
MGTWAARMSWHTAQGRDSNGQAISYVGNMLLCAAALTVLLVIGMVKENPGPGVETENTLQVLCSGCDRNLKSGTQCDRGETGSALQQIELKQKNEGLVGGCKLGKHDMVRRQPGGKDGLHINLSAARRLSQLYSRVCGFGGGGHNSKE